MKELILLPDLIILRDVKTNTVVTHPKTSLMDAAFSGEIIFYEEEKFIRYKATDLQNAAGVKFTLENLLTTLQDWKNEAGTQTPTRALQIIADDIVFKNTAVPIAMRTSASIVTNDESKLYILKATRKKANSSGNTCKIINFNVTNKATNDACVLMLYKNPQIVGGGSLTYQDRGLIEEATDLDKEVVPNTGELLFSIGIKDNGGLDINLTMEGVHEYVLVVQSNSGNQKNIGTINTLNL